MKITGMRSWLGGVSVALLLMSGQVLAAEVEVTWQDPQSYRDIHPTDELPQRYHARVFEELEKVFVRLGERLPEDQRLHIVVTDLDMAGNVETLRTHRGLERVRVLRPGYQPRMSLDYELYDADGELIRSGSERMQGRMTPSSGHINRPGFQDTVKYEADMIERWFRRHFDV